MKGVIPRNSLAHGQWSKRIKRRHYSFYPHPALTRFIVPYSPFTVIDIACIYVYKQMML